MHRRHGKHSTRGCGHENSTQVDTAATTTMGGQCNAVDSVVRCIANVWSVIRAALGRSDRHGTWLSSETCMMRTGDDGIQ